MSSVNHEELVESMRAAYGPVFNTRNYETGLFDDENFKRDPIMIWGAPGIGKSDVVKSFGRTMAAETAVGTWLDNKYVPTKDGRTFFDWNKSSFLEKKRLLFDEDFRRKVFIYVDFRLVQCDAVDIRGCLAMTDTDNLLTWKTPLVFLVLCEKGAAGILFFDEFTCAPPMVQTTCLQPLLDHSVGDNGLQRDVYILAAGNTAEHRASVYEMSAPVANRFCHAWLSAPSVKDWAKNYAYGHGVDDRIIAYLMWKPDAFISDAKCIKDAKNQAFATARSWVMASRQIRGLSVDKCRMPVSNCVGDANGSNFVAFLKVYKTINVNEIFENPTAAIKKYGKDSQLLWALTSVVTSRYVEEPKLFPKVMEIVEGLWNTADWNDYAVALMQMVRHCSLHCGHSVESFSKQILKFPKYMKTLAVMDKFLGKDSDVQLEA